MSCIRGQYCPSLSASWSRGHSSAGLLGSMLAFTAFIQGPMHGPIRGMGEHDLVVSVRSLHTLAGPAS